MGEDERASEDAEKDLYPPDTAFGRAASADDERVERGESVERSDAPRAAGKAEPEGEDDDGVDEASEESFPASDAPSSTGSVAGT